MKATTMTKKQLINFLQEKEENLWNEFLRIQELMGGNSDNDLAQHAQRAWYEHLKLLQELEIPTINDLRMAKFTGDK